MADFEYTETFKDFWRNRKNNNIVSEKNRIYNEHIQKRMIGNLKSIENCIENNTKNIDYSNPYDKIFTCNISHFRNYKDMEPYIDNGQTNTKCATPIIPDSTYLKKSLMDLELQPNPYQDTMSKYVLQDLPNNISVNVDNIPKNTFTIINQLPFERLHGTVIFRVSNTDTNIFKGNINLE
jgi:hypothetical protein